MVQPQETHRPPMRSVLEAYVSITAATYTAKAGDRVIGVNRAGVVTVTLPTAEVRKGRTYTVKDESGAAATNNVTIATEGSENIDGTATDVISDNYGSKTYYSDGTNWFEVPLLAAASHTLDSHSGTLQHEKGGLEANVSAITTGGIFRGSGAGAVGILADFLTAGDKIKHEMGGLESDVNAGDGFVEIKAGSTTVIKSNTAATAAPGATDDSAAGYAVGSVWIDTTNDKAYVCLDATATAAVWTEITQAGGGGGSDISARVWDSALLSVANATWTTVTFNTEDYDTDTIHDTSTNSERLTATTAGKYIVVAFMMFDGNATGRRAVRIRLNGTAKITQELPFNGTDSATGFIVLHFNLAATDYLDFQVYQTSGGALNLRRGETQSQIMMMKVLG